MKPIRNGIEHNLQNSVEEGTFAPMLQVERKSPPSAAEFAFEGQDTLGQDCSLDSGSLQVHSRFNMLTWIVDDIISNYHIIKISF